MATFAEIKARIVTELVRDDLEDDLASQLTLHIQRACEYFADERFWFNAYVGTVSTVGGQQTVTVPADCRRVERVSVPASQVDVREVLLSDIPDWTASSVPQLYAYDNDTLYFHPTPDAVYSLRLVGTKQIDAPVDDTDENEWTVEAQDLIVARAKMTLLRDQFRDPQGVEMAMGATQEALQRLKRETARRLAVPLRPRYPRPASNFNINTGC